MRAAQRAFEQFVVETRDDLLRTAYLMTWDLSESEDLVQETFIRTARRWDRIQSMEHRLAYVRKILVNLVFDDGKRRSRRRAELSAADAWPAEQADVSAQRPFDQVDDLSQLRDALAALPRQQRAVLVLRYWQDLSEAEVAQVLGCSVGTVKKTAWRAVQRLRQILPPSPAKEPALNGSSTH